VTVRWRAVTFGIVDISAGPRKEPADARGNAFGLDRSRHRFRAGSPQIFLQFGSGTRLELSDLTPHRWWRTVDRAGWRRRPWPADDER